MNYSIPNNLYNNKLEMHIFIFNFALYKFLTYIQVNSIKLK